MSNFVNNQAQVKMSKKMSSALRHRAEDMKLNISSDGYVSVEELLQHHQFRGHTLAQLEECVAKCAKQRFQLITNEKGKLFVRATQGHSISAVKDDELLQPITDPATIPVCLHGTYAIHIDSIKRTGLNRMKRNNIHLIACLPEEVDSVMSGMRNSADTIVTINVADAMAAGIPFYRSSNDVILSPGLGDTGCIPPEFIESFLRRGGRNEKRAGPPQKKADSPTQSPHSEKADVVNVTSPEETAFTHYCVIDFEATCVESEVIRPQEIIEFPAVMLSATSLEVVTEFHSYVRPLFHPTLTEFCTNLTGITQRTVDSAPEFSEVYHSFLSFLKDFTASYVHDHEGQEPNILFVSHGDWDFRTMLPSQCQTSGLQVPPPLTRWMNVKVLYTNSSAGNGKKKGMGMERMLADLGLELVGRHHSGIDDSRNIARILVELVANRGAVPVVTGDNHAHTTKDVRYNGRGGGKGGGRGGGKGNSKASHKANKYSVISI